MASPKSPNLKLFFAPSSFLASPAEFINLKPPITNIKSAMIPEKISRAVRRLEKIMGIQSRVATSLITFPAASFCIAQSPHALNMSCIIREYQRKDRKASNIQLCGKTLRENLGVLSIFGTHQYMRLSPCLQPCMHQRIGYRHCRQWSGSQVL